MKYKSECGRKKFVYFGIIYETINMIYGSRFSARLEIVLGHKVRNNYDFEKIYQFFIFLNNYI